MPKRPMIRQKEQLRYRPGAGRNCLYCASYIPDCTIELVSGRTRVEPRCSVMGTQASPLFRIAPGHTCDAQEDVRHREYLTVRPNKQSSIQIALCG